MRLYQNVHDKLSRAAVLEQLAEECTELAKAALKLARIERAENPTPVTENKAMDDLVEELADVRLCVDALESYTGELDTSDAEYAKYKRWISRLA